jgi:hypothetical protein
MDSDHPEKLNVYYKIKKIEEDLKADYYKLIEDKPLDEPAIGRPKPITGKKFTGEKDEAEVAR